MPKRNRKVRRGLVFLLILLFGIVGPVQGQSQLDRVEAELAKTDKLIEEARVIVAESGSEQGMQYLEKAIYLQEQARQKYAERNLGMAERLTLLARENAEKAIAIIQKSNESKGYVEREIDKTDEIIQSVCDNMMTASIGYTGTMLESAIATQNKARELFLQNRQKMALAATLRARELVQKGAESIQISEQAGRELEKTDLLLDRAREMLAQLELAQTPPDFENAMQVFQQARQQYDGGNYRQSQELALKARQQILEAINRFEKKLQEENFPRLLEDIAGKLEQAAQALRQNTNTVAEKYIERSREEIRLAREAHQDGDLQRAMYHLRRANRFLNETTEIISP